MAIAVQTPCKPNQCASTAASVRRTPHMLARFISEGLSVSPAPTHTQLPTMAAANIGSAKASMRSTCVPRSRISSTGVIRPIISGAKTYITTPIKAITAIPIPTVNLAKLRHKPYCPAPILCPTSVVAASPIPYPGM